jgi:hypothetical protein
MKVLGTLTASGAKEPVPSVVNGASGLLHDGATVVSHTVSLPGAEAANPAPDTVTC